MDTLYQLIAPAAQRLHTESFAFGPVPAGVLIIAALLAIGLIGRALSPIVIVIPGFILGAATGWWGYTQHWHPLLAMGAGIAIAALIYLIFSGFFAIRLATALVVAPIAVWAVWHLASSRLDLIWALFITIAATFTLGSLLRTFVASEDHGLRTWIVDLRDMVTGD